MSARRSTHEDQQQRNFCRRNCCACGTTRILWDTDRSWELPVVLLWTVCVARIGCRRWVCTRLRLLIVNGPIVQIRLHINHVSVFWTVFEMWRRHIGKKSLFSLPALFDAFTLLRRPHDQKIGTMELKTVKIDHFADVPHCRNWIHLRAWSSFSLLISQQDTRCSTNTYQFWR